MTRMMLFAAAGALALAPAIAVAGPGKGSTSGAGWTHSNGPTSTGQPGAECGDEDAPFTPGNSAAAPGSAFNPNGNAGTHYAGEQPQNSRNTASVSQYDTACLHQPH
jgi:hypothetical protein